MKTYDKAKKYLEEIEKNNKKGKKINAILELDSDVLEKAKKIDNKIKSGKAGKLAGQIIGVKANICVKNLFACCGSEVLKNFKAPYNAEVIQNILKEDGLIIGMCNCDEFASGGSGETSAFGPTKNPTNLEFIPGGSSSGSAAAVAADFCDMSLGSDTGGSIRNPASFCGIVGIKPTYSSVSRAGLIDLSMSLDQIGVFAKNITEASLFLDIIKENSKKDSIFQKSKKINLKKINNIPKNIKIGLLDFKTKNSEIEKLINEKVEKAGKKYSWKIKKIKIDNIELGISTYFPLVYVEFFSGTRKFDGRLYGNKIEENAGPEVLRRIFGGEEITKSEYSGRYYYKALKAKRYFEKTFEKLFKEVDCIISPSVARLPWKIGENISFEEMYRCDVLTIPYNLYGNCALSLPIGKIKSFPIGMQIACDKFEEEKMLRIARGFECLNE